MKSFKECSSILNEIGIMKKMAARTMRGITGRKLPASAQIHVDTIDTAINHLKNSNTAHPLVQTFVPGAQSMNKDDMINHMYKLRSRIVRGAKEQNKDVAKKIAVYGIAPPAATTALGIAATYHAGKKYAAPYQNN